MAWTTSGPPGSEAKALQERPFTQGGEQAFAAVNAAFGSLGRVCMALDRDLRVLYASELLDTLVGPGAAKRLRGSPVEALLGEEMFGAEGPLRRALLAGEKREGWRAMLRSEDGRAQLMAVSACPLQHDKYGVCAPEATYLVVLRPADEATLSAEGTVAGFGLIGRSQAMAHLLRMVDTLRTSEATVLITGDSGTGKEVVARIVHANSPRRSGPFVAVNPAALPGELLESELFGHVRGAFTGAVRDRVGRFESANDGTLFLDEVGELPLHLQVKLLRVLQERTFERVGEGTTRPTNARIIAATNRNLRAEVAEGRFREDLYYRLRVFPVEVPPLRARREDIEPMAALLLSRAGARAGRALRLSPDAVRVMLSYDWPGNVRELENALEFATTVCRGQTVQPEDLPPEILESLSGRTGTLPPPPAARLTPDPWRPRAVRPPPRPQPRPQPPPDEAGERERLLQALEANRWSRNETARALGMSRSTLWRRMRALRLG